MTPEAEPTEDLLTRRRAETIRRIEALTGQFDVMVEASELSTNDDEHDPEGATVAFERAQVQSMLREAQEELAELGRAADRLREGTYGFCERCGNPIAPERLAALPATRTCISCANKSRRWA